MTTRVRFPQHIGNLKKQNDDFFADGIFKFIFVYENHCILRNILKKLIDQGPVNNKPALRLLMVDGLTPNHLEINQWYNRRFGELMRYNGSYISWHHLCKKVASKYPCQNVMIIQQHMNYTCVSPWLFIFWSIDRLRYLLRNTEIILNRLNTSAWNWCTNCRNNGKISFRKYYLTSHYCPWRPLDCTRVTWVSVYSTWNRNAFRIIHPFVRGIYKWFPHTKCQ